MQPFLVCSVLGSLYDAISILFAHAHAVYNHNLTHPFTLADLAFEPLTSLHETDSIETDTCSCSLEQHSHVAHKDSLEVVAAKS